MPTEKQLANLQPNIKTKEQAQRLGRKGGMVSQQRRKAKKREQEEWATLLSATMKQGKAEKLECLKEANNKNLTISEAMKVKLVSEALKGNIRAYEIIMHYAGADEETEDSREQEQRDDSNTFIQALEGKVEGVWSDEE